MFGLTGKRTEVTDDGENEIERNQETRPATSTLSSSVLQCLNPVSVRPIIIQ